MSFSTGDHVRVVKYGKPNEFSEDRLALIVGQTGKVTDPKASDGSEPGYVEVDLDEPAVGLRSWIFLPDEIEKV